MRQIGLQLKTRIQQNVNIIDGNVEVRKFIFHTMMLILAGLGLAYVLILGNMVFNIVERRGLEKEALVLINEVGGLELSYLSVSGSVDSVLSSSMGFKEAHANFAIRQSLGYNTTDEALGILNLANNEI
jgi:hypothetical protein